MRRRSQQSFRFGHVQCRGAFSLLDMVVTLAIIGLMAGVAAPRFGHALKEYRLDAAANRIASDLAFARKRARTTGATETVTFDLASHTYSFSSIEDPDSPGRPYAVTLKESPYEVQISRVKFGASKAVTFNGYGFPESPGKMVISIGKSTRTLVVDSVTGSVTQEGS